MMVRIGVQSNSFGAPHTPQARLGILMPTLASPLRHPRPVLHLLRPALCLLSLALCLTFVGLGIRSYWVGYGVVRLSPGHFLNVTIARGTLAVDTGEAIGPKVVEWTSVTYPNPDPSVIAGTGTGWFGYIPRLSGMVVWMPLWSLVVFTGILPVHWVYRRWVGKGHEGDRGFPVDT